jgi:hypothetical protein
MWQPTGHIPGFLMVLTLKRWVVVRSSLFFKQFPNGSGSITLTYSSENLDPDKTGLVDLEHLIPLYQIFSIPEACCTECWRQIHNLRGSTLPSSAACIRYPFSRHSWMRTVCLQLLVQDFGELLVFRFCQNLTSKIFFNDGKPEICLFAGQESRSCGLVKLTIHSSTHDNELYRYVMLLIRLEAVFYGRLVCS